MTMDATNTTAPRVEVKAVGQIEIARRGGYVWTDGYAVVVDGRELVPWLPKRAAKQLARRIREEGAVTR